MRSGSTLSRVSGDNSQDTSLEGPSAGFEQLGTRSYQNILPRTSSASHATSINLSPAAFSVRHFTKAPWTPSLSVKITMFLCSSH